MLRVVGKICIFLIPVFIVLGLIRSFAMGQDMSEGILPSWDKWVGWFDTFPNIGQELGDAMEAYTDTFTVSGPYWWQIIVISAHGFFTNWDRFLNIIWILIGAPFRVLGWFFVNFFNPTSISTPAIF